MENSAGFWFLGVESTRGAMNYAPWISSKGDPSKGFMLESGMRSAQSRGEIGTEPRTGDTEGSVEDEAKPRRGGVFGGDEGGCEGSHSRCSPAKRRDATDVDVE